MIVLTAAKATIIDAVTPTSPPGRLSRLHWIQGGAQPSSITLACTMSSTSSSPSPNRSASPNTPLTPPPLPAADGYMNALRLDPIIEHVQADHVQRTRAHSVSSVSFKGGAKPPPQAPAVAQPKAKPAPRVRASSPPPSRQVSPFFSFSSKIIVKQFSGSEKREHGVPACYLYLRTPHAPPRVHTPLMLAYTAQVTSCS